MTENLQLGAEMSRKNFFVEAGLAGATAFLVTPESAFAAKYGSFGAGSPEVLDPSEAEIDSAVLSSSAVQNALKSIKGYQTTVQQMQSLLESDPQANLRPLILKELDFSNLRQTLNTFNTAFEEDTQRGTDRLIRNIMQDITELETANNQKDGIPRSDRRLDIMKGKLAKLDQAFSDYLAFAK